MPNVHMNAQLERKFEVRGGQTYRKPGREKCHRRWHEQASERTATKVAAILFRVSLHVRALGLGRGQHVGHFLRPARGFRTAHCMDRINATYLARAVECHDHCADRTSERADERRGMQSRDQVVVLDGPSLRPATHYLMRDNAARRRRRRKNIFAFHWPCN